MTEKCLDCKRPVEREGYSRCDRCCEMWDNMSITDIFALSDEGF